MAAMAVAKLAVVVDLPTPPLPEATAMMFFTPLMVWMPACTLWATMLFLMVSCTSLPVAAAICRCNPLARNCAGKPKVSSTCRLPPRSSSAVRAFSLPMVRSVPAMAMDSI